MAVRDGKPKEGDTNYLIMKYGAAIAFDCVESVQHSRVADTTDNETEEFVASDHYVRQPKTLQIEALVSDAPLSAETTYDKDADGWHTQVFDMLERAWRLGERVRFITHQASYNSMVITNFSAPVTPDNSRALKVSLTLKEIRVALTETTEIKPPDTEVMKLMRGKITTAFKSVADATSKQASAINAKLNPPAGASVNLNLWQAPR